MLQRMFISAASDDYEPLRQWLAPKLRTAGFVVVRQEEFSPLGLNTLVMLAESIRKESGTVLHIVGTRLGSVPPPDVLEKLLSHCVESKLRGQFPKLFDNNTYRRISYTQWEPWLAIFFGKHLLPCLDMTPPAGTTGPAAAGAMPIPVAEHVKLLKSECGYFIEFADRAELLEKVQSALSRLGNLGTFHEDKPHN